MTYPELMAAAPSVWLQDEKVLIAYGVATCASTHERVVVYYDTSNGMLMTMEVTAFLKSEERRPLCEKANQ